MGTFIAVDWGTTNRRAYAIKDGEILGRHDGRGVKSLAPAHFPAEIAEIRLTLGDLPVLCAGMVGSNIGWHETPYVATPATLPQIARAVRPFAERVWIAPGVSTTHRRLDVMRGEEIQFLGADLLDPTRSDTLLCQPGTHTKWARMQCGVIVDFTTVMTGEMFGLLRDHSVLAPFLKTEAIDEIAFAQGVRASVGTDLIRDLFTIRAGELLNMPQSADAASYLSGLLIGQDIQSAALSSDRPICIIDDGPLGARYAAALAILERTSTTLASTAAFCAGACALWEDLGHS